MVKIAPSVLSADFGRLAEEVAKVEGVADLLHVDVMDGHFVPNLTVGPPVVEAIRRHSRLPLDVHLMMEGPECYIDAFARAGADYLTVHIETCPHLHRTLEQIREAGVKPGVALNPATPIHTLEHVLDRVDLVLIMSVDPGFGGQTFIPFALGKIEALARRLAGTQARPDLAVDGGLNGHNCRDVVEAGATMLVMGSTVFGSPDPKAAIREIRERIGRG